MTAKRGRGGRVLVLAGISTLVLGACSSSTDSIGVSNARVDRGIAIRFDTRALIGALQDAGSSTRPDGPRRFDQSFEAFARAYCVEGARLEVYEYHGRAGRRAVSGTISVDGSGVRNSHIDWRGPPHFYARGRIIVLVVADAPKLNGQLTEILGPSLSPEAEPGRGTLGGIRCSART